MNNYIFYFAYGSNMSIERLKSRINSAKFVCVAQLYAHKLEFHKISKKDGSGKCDAFYTGNFNDIVFGAVYSISMNQLKDLDKFEGCGSGYKRKTVLVNLGSDEILNVETYIATSIDSLLRPLDWYKEHVLRGAQSIALPNEYISMINAVEAKVETDDNKRISELSIYKK